MSGQPDIIYTKVDEAPELASGSFLPIIQSFASSGCWDLESWHDLSKFWQEPKTRPLLAIERSLGENPVRL